MQKQCEINRMRYAKFENSLIDSYCDSNNCIRCKKLYRDDDIMSVDEIPSG